MALTNQRITIGKGLISRVINKLGLSSNGVYFGYDDTLKSGVVVANGKLVSSKLLDLQVTASDTITGVSSIKLSYIDTASKSIKEESFDIINYNGVSSIISEVINNDFITTDENSNTGITITPVTDENDNITKYSIAVNLTLLIDNDSIFVNDDNKLVVNKYSLTKADEVTNANNAAEYIFTTFHADGTEDTTTIEIPVAEAIKTANLSKYLKGSALDETQKESLGDDFDENSYYEINLDTDSVTKVSALPSLVKEGETYIHFEWGGENATPTFLDVADIAVNYAQGDYIKIENNTISVDYNSLLTDISTAIGVDDINSSLGTLTTDLNTTTENLGNLQGEVNNISEDVNSLSTDITTVSSKVDENTNNISELDQIINGTEDVLYTADEAKAENDKHLVIDEFGIEPGEDGYNETYEDGYIAISAGDIKIKGEAGLSSLTDKLDTLEQLIGEGENNISDRVDNVDSSINDLKEHDIVTDTSISNLTDSLSDINKLINVTTADELYTEEEAAAENAKHLIADESGINPGEENYNTTYEEGYNPVSSGDIKEKGTTCITDLIGLLDTSIKETISSIETTSNSVQNLYDRLTWIDLDETVSE